MKGLIILLCAAALVSCGGGKTTEQQQTTVPTITYTFMTILTEEPELVEENGRFAVSMEKGAYTSDIIELIDDDPKIQDSLKTAFKRQILRLMDARQQLFGETVAVSDASSTDKEWLLNKGKAALLESRLEIFDSRREAEDALEKQRKQ